MPDAPPLTGASFYDTLPPPNHRTGDIWSGLPTFGMLGRRTAAGIVITPACDLANRKTETITYLPVLPASDYLASSACRYECWQEITQVLARLPNYGAIFPPDRFDLMADEELEELIGQCVDSRGRPLPSGDVDRLRAYQQYVSASRRGEASITDLKGFFKPERLDSLLSRLVTNGFKPDIHFLPADAEVHGARPVPVHSVVLFRYPFTVPVAVLDAAQSSSETQWQGCRETWAQSNPVFSHMSDWPVKLASLKGEFLSDLISRYLGIHIRLGSADFSEHVVQTFCAEIGG